MGLIGTVAGAIKKVSVWAAKNPVKAMDTVSRMESLCFGKAYMPNDHADRLLVMEQRLNQLQAKTEKQEKKLEAFSVQMQAMDQRIRKLQIWLTVTGVALALALVAVALFAFVI